MTTRLRSVPRKPAQCASTPRARLERHVDGRPGRPGCAVCDAALDRAAAGTAALGRMCPVGRAYVLTLLSPGAREFVERAGAALDSMAFADVAS